MHLDRSLCSPRGFRLALVAAVALWGLSAPAPADTSRRDRDDDADPRTRAILARLDDAQRKITTFRARLTERRELAVLAKPEILTGQLTFARPGRIRWEYDAPDSRIYVLSDGHLTGWIPAENRAEKLDISRRRGRIERLIGFGQGAEALEREFRVSLGTSAVIEGTDELLLVPKSRRVRRRIQEIRLWVDATHGLPRQIRYLTGDGDTITLTMRDFAVNPELAKSAFELEIPPGAKIVEGLSSLALPGQDADARDERVN